MSNAEMYHGENADVTTDGLSPNELTSQGYQTLRDILDEPITLQSYPWEENEYSSTPLGWHGIANNGYYFPALRFTRKRIESNTSNKIGVKKVVDAALEECNHAHAQVCEYSEASIAALREDISIDELVDDTTCEMIQAARTGLITVAQAGLLLLMYPKLGSLEAARHTVGFAKNGFAPFDEFIAKSLSDLQEQINESQAPLQLELIEPDNQGLHCKESHADAALGVRVEKHPIVTLEKRTLARLSGAFGENGEMVTLELVEKKSIIAKQYEHLLGADMSPDILGAVYWRDVRTKKPPVL
jgi:hypothetical protein